MPVTQVGVETAELGESLPVRLIRGVGVCITRLTNWAYRPRRASRPPPQAVSGTDATIGWPSTGGQAASGTPLYSTDRGDETDYNTEKNLDRRFAAIGI